MFDFNINRKISSALENNPREHCFLSLDKIKKVLILFTYQDWTEIQQILQDLQSKGKEVVLWTVQATNEINASITLPANVRVVTQSRIKKLLGVDVSIVEEFKGQEYDALFDLTTHEDKSLLYLLANSKARFCIGIKELDRKFYDFVVLKKEDKTLSETYDQIKFYLNNIR